jgi:GT2 family glycosyltransferase
MAGTNPPYRWGEPVWEKLFDHMAEEIVDRLHPGKALDVGCAVGFLVKSLCDRGVDAHGVEVSEFALSQVPAAIRDRCWHGSIVDELDGEYDLITCIEVMEHLSPREAPEAVANLCRHARAVLFSCTPDQFGDVTHVNVQPPAYWAGLFARHGFYHDLDFDASFVSPDALLLRPAESPAEAVAAYEGRYGDALRELEAARAHRDLLHWQMDEALGEREEAVAELQALLHTKTFRLTSPLRQAWVRTRQRRGGTAHTGPQPAPPTYLDWVERYDTLDEAGERELSGQLERLARRPRFSILMPVFDPAEEHLRQALDSVVNQIYPEWQLCVADDRSTTRRTREVLEEYRRQDPRIEVAYRRRNGGISRASNTALELADGDYLVLLDDNDELAAHALGCLALELDRHPDVLLVYSDEDKLDAFGHRVEPYFKPDWNPPLLLGQNCLSHLTCFRRQDVVAVGGFRIGMEGSQDHDLALRVAERAAPSQIRHVPLLLYHWRMHPGSTAASLGAKPFATSASRRAVVDHLRRTRIPGDVLPAPARSGNRVRRRAPRRLPSVAVTVFGDLLEDAERTVGDLMPLTSYPDVQMTPSAATLFRRPPTQTTQPGATGRVEARDELVCSIVAGVEVMDENWLHELVAEFAEPEVGMVGARLESRDGRLARGPLAMGPGGEVLAPLDGVDRNQTGYFGRAWLVHDIAALSPGCFAIRRSVLEEVGGTFSTAGYWQVVELCLRVRRAGYRIRWTPYSRLEIVDRSSIARSGGGLRSPALRLPEGLQRLYHHLLAADPAYSPNLSLDPQSPFGLAWPPRRDAHWNFLDLGGRPQPRTG